MNRLAESTTATTAPPRRELADRHREELHASGLTDATIEAAGIRTVRDSEIAEILGWQPKDHAWNTGWFVPFPGSNGRVYGQIKLDWPRGDGNGRTLKYESPIRQQPRAYKPAGFAERFATAPEILLTEGTKKTLRLWQAGHCAIGLTGVWNWQRKRLKSDSGKAYGRRHLIPDLADLDWHGKTVILIFDSDAASNPNVQAAEAKLAESLISCGAAVKVARLPQNGDAKVGADDFLVAHGEAALREILDAAVEPELPRPPTVLDLAAEYVAEYLREPAGPRLRWHQDEFYAYNGCRYCRVPDTELQAVVHPWLDNRIDKCRPHHVRDLVTSFRSVDGVRVPFDRERPCWLNGEQTDARTVVAFKNALVDIGNTGADLQTWPHTPAFFSTVCLPYEFDPTATCPTFDAWLQDTFGGDAECIQLADDWCGLLLTSDTRFQKIAAFYGPPRSGKGTLIRVLTAVLGDDACASPTLTSLVSEFGLSQLVDKTACFFPDAHLGRATAPQVLDVLKSVSGEDRVSVNRKHLPHLTGVRLRCRFTLSVNQMPRLHDASGALASRLLILPFPNSYLGREDLSLEQRLQAEASGILNRWLRGLHRLRQRGHFVVPAAAAELQDSYERLASPVTAFIQDRCVLSPELSTPTSRLFAAWRTWCEDAGHESGSEAAFGTSLVAAAPAVRKTRRRVNESDAETLAVAKGALVYRYSGIGLSDGGI